MSLSLEAAAELFRDAMRQAVRRHAFWYQAEGLLLVLAGMVSIIYPFFSSVAVVVLLGWLLIVSGLAQAVSVFKARHLPQFWLQLASVLLAVLIGILFLRDPAQGLLTLTLLLIVFFVIEGMSKIVFALTIRPFPNWAWVLGSGIVGLVLAAVLMASMPVTATWLIGFLLGVELVSVGGAMAYLAFRTRQGSDDAG